MKFWQKAKHWRQRAEEVRAIRDELLKPKAYVETKQLSDSARATLDRIAREYDELAQMAEDFSQEKRTVYRELG